MATKEALLARSPDIQQMLPYWERVGAIIRGLDALRAISTEALPKFPDESDKDYAFRLSLSKLTNVYRDVVEGLASKPFEEEVAIIGGDDVPQEVYDFCENVDGSGSLLSQFAALTFFNGINYAVDWIFVDFPSAPTDRPLSRAEARALNLRPFWTHVLAQNVLEVRTEVIGGAEVLSYLRMKEPDVNGTPRAVRVFNRTAEGVFWELHEQDKDGNYAQVSGGRLSIDRIPMVPFVTGRRDGRTWRFFPPMQDAADLQITLYQNETALEYTTALAGYPMLAANGMKPQMGADGKTPVKVAIGPARVLYGVPDGAGNHGEWRFIEPSANSLEFLKKKIDSTKQDLRELGRQPLTALSSQLTNTTTAIAAGKAKSAVTAWALALKDALENALQITMLYMGSTYEPEVNVYTGFDNVLDDGSDLETLDKARERRDLSQETYWFELKRRKILSPEFKGEDEVKRLLDEIPSDGLDISNPPNPAGEFE